MTAGCTGLRAKAEQPDGSAIPNGSHLASYTQINFGVSHLFHIPQAGTLTARFDVINAFDKNIKFAMEPALASARRNLGPAAASAWGYGSPCKPHGRLSFGHARGGGVFGFAEKWRLTSGTRYDLRRE